MVVETVRMELVDWLVAFGFDPTFRDFHSYWADVDVTVVVAAMIVPWHCEYS